MNEVFCPQQNLFDARQISNVARPFRRDRSFGVTRRFLNSFFLAAALLIACVFVVRADDTTAALNPSVSQTNATTLAPRDADGRAPLVIESDSDSDVFGLGRSVVIRGNVKRGVIAFGGDVTIEGRVEGDVAAIGGSVIQLEKSFIGGDVIVFGGAYHHGKNAPGRNPASATYMVAGYEDELRSLMRNPTTLFTPRWTPTALALRLLSILCWFIISLALTAAAPGLVSRGAARLQLTSLHVAVIGLLAAVILFFGVPAALTALPSVFGFLVGAMSGLLLLLSYLFGRVVIQAATGKWLQRVLFKDERQSESVALLTGAICWGVILALPYVWVFALVGVLILSLGLTLTSRHRRLWNGASGGFANGAPRPPMG